MHAEELVRGFLIDLLRLPIFFKLAIFWMAGSAAWQWWTRRQHAALFQASDTWPTYRARVIAAQNAGRERDGEDGPSYWEGLLTYSYTVPGHELEIGEHRQRFSNESDTDTWASALSDTSIEVRVDPTDPTRSIWHEPANNPAAFNPPLQGQFEPSSLRQTAVFGVLTISAAGAGIAAWIQFSCLLGKPVVTFESNTTVFFSMHIGAMVCAVVSGLLSPRGLNVTSYRSWNQHFDDNSVARKALKLLSIYYAVIFLYAWVRMASSDENSSFWGILLFSAGWLLFYLSSAAVCWQTLRNE